jgi:hypothetical protein
MGASSSDRRGGPAIAASEAGKPAPDSASAPTGLGADQPGAPTKRATPVYKKWWFWAVIGVTAYVGYELATSSSTTSRDRGRGLAPPAGATLFSW